MTRTHLPNPTVERHPNRGRTALARSIGEALSAVAFASAALALAALLSVALLAVAANAQAAPQWLSPQTVSPTGLDASEQQVAFDPGGDAVVVWRGAGPPHNTIIASVRPAGGVFGPTQTLSDAGEDSQAPDVAIDAHGDALAVWLRYDGSDERVQAAYRPAGGAFGTPQTLSEAGVEATGPRVAMNGAGEAVVVWSVMLGGKEEIQAAPAAPGGAFGTPVNLTGFSVVASVPQVALDSHGDAIAVWDGYDGTNIRIEDAIRAAGGGFGAAQFLSPAGSNADTPQVAFDAAGNALAVWRFDGSPASTVQGAYRPAGGSFAPAQTISTPSPAPAQAPQVAFDGSSEGVVAWKQSDGSEPRVYASVRSAGAGGTYSAPSVLDPSGPEAYEPQIAGDGQSATIVSWKTFNGITSSTQAAVRPAGGSFSAATTVSATGPEEGTPEVGVDAQGDGIAVWSRFNGSNYLVEAAGYDGAGPLLRGLLLPTTGTVGAPLQFFQAPLDVWSPVLSESFSFGDGAGASGVSATHVYTAPGTYTVSATASDVLGNATTVTQAVTILPAPPTPGVGTAKPTVKHKPKHKRHHKRRRRHRPHGHGHGHRHGRGRGRR
jgi:PKD repeat protein